MTKIERKVIGVLRDNAAVIILVLATLAGASLRLSGMNFESSDFITYLSQWWNFIAARDFSGLSEQVGNYNIPYQMLTFLLTRITDNALYAYKLVSIVFDFVLAVGVGMLAAEYRREKLLRIVPVLAYSVTLCSLTVVLNSAFWGQCDSMYVSMIVFAILLTMKERHIPAFVLLGVALSFKLQMVFILPLYIYYYMSARKVSILHFLIIPLTDILLCLPAFFCGRPFWDVINIYAGQTSLGDQIQMNCPNIYALMCDKDTVEYYFLLKPFAVVLTAGVLAAGLFIVLHKRVDLSNREKFMMTGIWTAFTCLMFLPAMHERYSYLLDILLIAYFFMTRRHPFVALISLLISLRGCCYYLFRNYEAFTNGQAAVINIALYAYVTYIFVRETVLGKPSLRFAHPEKTE